MTTKDRVAGELLRFFVPGLPKSAGSKSAFAIKKNGRYIVGPGGAPVIAMRDSCDNEDWKRACAANAREAWGGAPAEAALRLDVEFVMPRPAVHHVSGDPSRPLRPRAPLHHCQKPDRTKLLRCLEDAMTGILWADDTIIVDGRVVKRWAAPGERHGAHVVVSLAPAPPPEGQLFHVEHTAPSP